MVYIIEEIIAHRPRGRRCQWPTHLAGTRRLDAERQPTLDSVGRDWTVTDTFCEHIKAHKLLPELVSSGILKDACYLDDNIQGLNSAAYRAQEGDMIAQRAEQ